MRILIKGATGFVGKRLTRSRGGAHEVFTPAKRPPPGRTPAGSLRAAI